MSSLFTSITMAQQALQLQQTGLEITQKNIANVNTPGYSRQRLSITPGDPSPTWPGVSLSVGDTLIESFRSRFLDYRVSQELQGQGAQDAVATALQQVEAIMSSGGKQSLDSVLSEFFGSFGTLANMPENTGLREEVLSRGQQLCDRLRSLYDQIQGVRTFQDYFVSDTVKDINELTAAFAAVNLPAAQAATLQSSDASELNDQRQAILDKLSGLIDISYFETESGALTVTTRQGAPLVLGDQCYELSAAPSESDGLLHIRLNGADITSAIDQGKLGGLLSVRDTITAYLSRLDDLAAGVIEHVNRQHALGSDLNGIAGGDFFVPFVPPAPGSASGAAHSIQMAITDMSEIAAAAAGSGPGSNQNARLLAAIADERLFSSGTATPIQFYSDLVYAIGRDVQAAEDALETQDGLLLQLQNQRDAFSAVNLDEEAVELLRYQKAYQATAQYIAVLDGLTEDLIRILGG